MVRSRIGLILLIPLACQVPAIGLSQPPRSPATPTSVTDARPDESADLRVSTGSVTMGGSTEVTCDLVQGKDDRVTLRITVTSECNTVGDLDVRIRTEDATLSVTVPVSLKERVSVTFPGPTLPPPGRGTAIHTRVKGDCEGPNPKVAWGAGPCVVP